MNPKISIIIVGVVVVGTIVGVGYTKWLAKTTEQLPTDQAETTIVDDRGLPPDPGEAGKATLEGIDSDNDGVRDDVQRYIVLTYPDSEKTRAAVFQYARALQKFVLNANDKNASLIHDAEADAAQDCLVYIRGVRKARENFVGLRAQLLNTPERSRAYIRADQQLSGQVFALTPDTQLKSSCSFDPDAMGN